MESTLQKAEDAHQLFRALSETLKIGRMTGIVTGQMLWKLKANNAFKKAIGAGVDTWNDFLKLPEISLEVREANRSMELYETFVVKYGYAVEDLAEAKTKSLHYLLPHAKAGVIQEERIRELVEDAKHLTQNQFKENLFDAKSGRNRTYQFVLMRKCEETGALQKVPTVTNDMIVEAFREHYKINVNELFIPEIL